MLVKMQIWLTRTHLRSCRCRNREEFTHNDEHVVLVVGVVVKAGSSKKNFPGHPSTLVPVGVHTGPGTSSLPIASGISGVTFTMKTVTGSLPGTVPSSAATVGVESPMGNVPASHNGRCLKMAIPMDAACSRAARHSGNRPGVTAPLSTPHGVVGMVGGIG